MLCYATMLYVREEEWMKCGDVCSVMEWDDESQAHSLNLLLLLRCTTDSAKTVRIIREARDELAAQTHPDPYIAPYMPGGSLFMRNPGIPLEALYPDGIPAHMSNRKVNIDMSNLDEGQEYANRVFVDSANKLYWIDK